MCSCSTEDELEVSHPDDSESVEAKCWRSKEVGLDPSKVLKEGEWQMYMSFKGAQLHPSKFLSQRR